MFVSISDHDNEKLTKNLSETFFILYLAQKHIHLCYYYYYSENEKHTAVVPCNLKQLDEKRS